MDSKTKTDLLEMMLRIRQSELKLAYLIKTGKIAVGGHLYEGEEAIATGVCANLRKDDFITSTHRGHGHCIAKGMDLKSMLAEVCGRTTGCCGGKGGTMHMFDPDNGIMGTIGIVGGGIPIATGLALSAQLRKTDQVAVSFFGDGASNNGTFHESLNMASKWKLPAIYICENNQYATSVAVWRSTSVKDIGVRGVSYDMPGITVDGNHVDEVYDAVKTAVARARAGEGPSLIECKTYRIRGHFEGDDTLDYRTREEVEEARKRDPIDYWKAKLIAEGTLDEAGFEAINAAVEKEIEDAATFAVESPFPAPEDALVLTAKR